MADKSDKDFWLSAAITTEDIPQANHFAALSIAVSLDRMADLFDELVDLVSDNNDMLRRVLEDRPLTISQVSKPDSLAEAVAALDDILFEAKESEEE